jgi:hypothetical protein
MPLITSLVLHREGLEGSSIKVELHAKSIVNGKFKSILSLEGSEDEWESFIRRIRRQLEIARTEATNVTS